MPEKTTRSSYKRLLFVLVGPPVDKPINDLRKFRSEQLATIFERAATSNDSNSTMWRKCLQLRFGFRL